MSRTITSIAMIHNKDFDTGIPEAFENLVSKFVYYASRLYQKVSLSNGAKNAT